LQIEGSVRRHADRAIETGAPAQDMPIRVTLLLRAPPSAPKLPDLEALSARPLAGASMDRAAFNESFSADAGDIAAVKAFAAQFGLEVGEVDPVKRTVQVSGTVAAMDKAFLVKQRCYSLDGAEYRSHEEKISVPESLHGVVVGVFGLDTRQIARRMHWDATTASASATATGRYPPAIAALYGFPTGEAVGKGQSIAIVELGGGYKPATLQKYFDEDIKTTPPAIVDVSVGGVVNTPASSASSEVYLDIEVVGSVAPGASLVVYFSTPTLQGFLEAVRAAVHDADHANSVVSISWGGAEHPENTMYTDAMNQTMQEAAALGITVLASTGDDGAADATSGTGSAQVNFPASSPWVLACGGTSVVASADAIESETVWNSSGKATGGGVSAIFPAPPYQTSAGIAPTSVNPGGGGGRGVPDVAACADRDTTGYLVLSDGVPRAMPTGGTSAAAPLWAALIAAINEAAGRNLGFVNPALYAQPVRTQCFNDILVGNNTTAAAPGYSASPGWDPCTGFGSPIGSALLKALTSAAPN
jgi:kumamolisin